LEGALTIAPQGNVHAAFEKTSYFSKDPEYGFGTGSRPPLSEPTPGPGPGAYVIKTTMGKLVESNFRSPAQYSLKGRTKFGDPNAKAMSKVSQNEPGPGQYDLSGKFLSGSDPRKSGFPKGHFPQSKAALSPGPGTYEPLQSMGKQPISTKPDAFVPVFPKASRPSMVPPGTTDIGPGQYGAFSAACEEQVDSRKPTCSSIKFGTGYRKSNNMTKLDLAEPSPGPGSYVLPGGVATKAKGSPYRDSPAATISGRNKFGSPW
jgi:hypothetical protein